MKISYHAWKDYQECPKKYFLRYRKKLPSPVPDNEYFTLYGRLVEKFFQMFSNIWRFSMPYMPPEEIRIKLDRLYTEILRVSQVDWTVSYAKYSKEEILEQAFNDVFVIMESMNQNFFFNTQSEIGLTIKTKEADITGRIDFVHKDAHNGSVMIFDGKGTDKIGKNIKEDQLLYYALLYNLHFKAMPVQLGFFYYRFNTFVPVPIDLNILNEFRAKLSSGITKIVSDVYFKATPCSKACKYCNYETICLDCQKDRADRRKKPKIELPDHEGIIEFGF